MELCSYARPKTDDHGRVEYYCEKCVWRIGLDGLDQCKNCPYYTCEKQADSK